MMIKFMASFVVTVSWIYTYLQTHQDVYFKYVTALFYASYTSIMIIKIECRPVCTECFLSSSGKVASRRLPELVLWREDMGKRPREFNLTFFFFFDLQNFAL